ncbi:MAG: hypothetical protein HC822_14865 [Oscillochloris sp.]|nr:hypothetical protein [Oscillochloris sp.]
MLSRDSLLLTAQAWVRSLDLPETFPDVTLRLRDLKPDESIRLRRIHGVLTITNEPTNEPAALVYELDAATLFELAGETLSLATAIQRGVVVTQTSGVNELHGKIG